MDTASNFARLQEEGEEQNQQKEQIQLQQKNENSDKIKKIIVLIILITVVLLSIINRKYILEQYKDFIIWLEHNTFEGFFILIGAYSIAAVCFFPGSILTLASGFCFYSALKTLPLALLVGVTAVFLGAFCGSIIAFFLGRYVFRDMVYNRAKNWIYFQAIDKAVLHNGFKVVLLFRLAPLTPFNVFNYLMGITSVKPAEYALAGIGMIPTTTIYVYFGTQISNIANLIAGKYDGGLLYIIFIVIGIKFAILSIFYISKLGRKQFQKILEEQEQESQELQESNVNSSSKNK